MWQAQMFLGLLYICLFRRFFVEGHEPGNERKRWQISENERRKEFRGKRSRTPTNSSCTRIPAHFEVICQSFFSNRVNESNRRVIIISHINKLLIIILAWMSKTNKGSLIDYCHLQRDFCEFSWCHYLFNSHNINRFHFGSQRLIIFRGISRKVKITLHWNKLSIIFAYFFAQ